jgi:hypothetical protein
VGFYDIYNGDADGLCALQQLRLAEPREATLVTGAKRDIALLGRVRPQPGDELTVLDVSMHANAAALAPALASGARIEWFDHHHAGDPPAHPRLSCHLDLSPDTCTSLIADRHLDGAHRAWAVAGAFGDNLAASALAAAQMLGLDAARLEALRNLGECLNYNAYGAGVEELLFHPAELHRRMRGFADPLAFAASDPAPRQLELARSEDLARALAVSPLLATPTAAAVVLPDAPWSRRVSGTLANRLAVEHPRQAHAVFTPQSGRYTVSLRAPRDHAVGADRLALAFGGGGGRAAAAGINGLPEPDIARVVEALKNAYA